jgi:hypothetical protein
MEAKSMKNSLSLQIFNKLFDDLDGHQKRLISYTCTAKLMGEEPKTCVNCNQPGILVVRLAQEIRWCCSYQYRECPTELEKERLAQEFFGKIYSKLTRYEVRQITCQMKYGARNAMYNSEIRKKRDEAYSKIDRKEVQRKMEGTNLKHFGVKNVMHNPEIKRRQEQGIIDATGYKHALQSPECQKKKTQTMIERFGVPHAMQNEEVKLRLKNYFQRTWGGHPMRNPEVRALQSSTFLANYTESYNLQRISTCRQKYGVDNPMQFQPFLDARKETDFRKYGCWFVETEMFQKKKTQTMIERFGVPHAMQNEKLFNQARETCTKTYGFPYATQSERVQENTKITCNRRYGVDYPNQAESVKALIRKTCFEHYGFSSHMQSPEFLSTLNLFRSKPFTLPSGQIINLQGCEPEVLKDLLKCFDEKEIVSHPKLAIKYWHPGQKRWAYYHPDFYVPYLNWIFEAKSTWWLNGNGGYSELMQINLAKRKACLEQGYKFNFILR